MFTNKTSRNTRTSENRQQYIEPFEEEDTDQNGKKTASSGYMAELDEWLEEVVFEPIERAIANEDSKELHIAFNESKQHIKRKVLQSYHNGLKTNQTRNQKNYGHQTYRRD